jgi:hypothetical protein
MVYNDHEIIFEQQDKAIHHNYMITKVGADRVRLGAWSFCKPVILSTKSRHFGQLRMPVVRGSVLPKRGWEQSC